MADGDGRLRTAQVFAKLRSERPTHLVRGAREQVLAYDPSHVVFAEDMGAYRHRASRWRQLGPARLSCCVV